MHVFIFLNWTFKYHIRDSKNWVDIIWWCISLEVVTRLNKMHTKTILLYSKICLQQPLKNRQKKILTSNSSLMKVKSIAECSLGAFCNTFDLHQAKIGIKSHFFFFLSEIPMIHYSVLWLNHQQLHFSAVFLIQVLIFWVYNSLKRSILPCLYHYLRKWQYEERAKS